MRRLARTSLFVSALAIAIPFIATPSGAGGSTPCLQVTPESDTNVVGAKHSVTAHVTDCDLGFTLSGVNVDFEIFYGPNTNLNGNAATADKECTTGTQGRCTVSYFGTGGAGTDGIVGWIDANLDDAFPGELDPTEVADEVSGPGTFPEPDNTDVVEKVWEVQACTGTNDNDIVTGTDGNDFCRGLGGDDHISTGFGNDTAEGGMGKDMIELGRGTDTGRGDAGDDYITCGQGTDTAIGGAGTDTFHPSCESQTQ